MRKRVIVSSPNVTSATSIAATTDGVILDTVGTPYPKAKKAKAWKYHGLRPTPESFKGRFPSVGDGTPRILSDKYADISDARTDFPLATAMTQTAEGCAIAQMIYVVSATHGSGRCELPAGTWPIDKDSTIQIPANFRLEGVACGQRVDVASFPTNGRVVLQAIDDNMLVMDFYNAHHSTVEGIAINAFGREGVTGVRLDSNNNPALTHIRFREFFINDCQVSVQWGQAPLYVAGVSNGSPMRVTTVTAHPITLPVQAPAYIDPSQRYFTILPTVGGRALTNTNYVFPQVQIFGVAGNTAANLLCYAKYVDSTHFDLYAGYDPATGNFSSPISGASSGTYVNGSGYIGIVVDQQGDESQILDFFIRSRKTRALGIWICSGNVGQQCLVAGGDIQFLGHPVVSDGDVTQYAYGIAAPIHAGGKFVTLTIGGPSSTAMGFGSGPNLYLEDIESEGSLVFFDNFQGINQGIDMERCVHGGKVFIFPGNQIRSTGNLFNIYEPQLGPGAFCESRGDNGREWQPPGQVFRPSRNSPLGGFPLRIHHGSYNATSLRMSGSGVFGGGLEYEFVADRVALSGITASVISPPTDPIATTTAAHLVPTGKTVTVYLSDCVYAATHFGQYFLNGGPYKFTATSSTTGTLKNMDGSLLDTLGFVAEQGYIEQRITSYAIVNFGDDVDIPQWGKNGDLLTFDRDSFLPVRSLCATKWDVFRNFSFNFYGDLFGADNTTPAGLKKNTYTGRLETTNNINSTFVISAATNAAACIITTFTPHGLSGNRSVTISGFAGTWAAANGHRAPVTITGPNTINIYVDSTTFGTMTGSPRLLAWDDLVVQGDLPILSGAFEPEGVIAATEGKLFLVTNASDPDKIIWKKTKNTGAAGGGSGSDPTYGWYPLNYFNNILPYPQPGGGVPITGFRTGSFAIGANTPPISNALTVEKWLGINTSSRTNASTILDVGAGESHFSDRVFADNKLDVASDLKLTGLTGAANGKFLRLPASKIVTSDAPDLSTTDTVGLLNANRVGGGGVTNTQFNGWEARIAALEAGGSYVTLAVYDAHTHGYITGGGAFSGTDSHGDSFSGTASTGSGNTGTHN